jgi:hypothetical protein
LILLHPKNAQILEKKYPNSLAHLPLKPVYNVALHQHTKIDCGYATS